MSDSIASRESASRYAKAPHRLLLGPPQQFFEYADLTVNSSLARYDVSPGVRRLVTIAPVESDEEALPPKIRIVQN